MYLESRPFKHTRKTFGGDGHFQQLNCGDGFTGVYMSKLNKLYNINICSVFIACQSYLNKAVRKLTETNADIIFQQESIVPLKTYTHLQLQVYREQNKKEKFSLTDSISLKVAKQNKESKQCSSFWKSLLLHEQMEDQHLKMALELQQVVYLVWF